MEIEQSEYVKQQMSIVVRLRDIATALRELILILDNKLNMTVERHNSTAYSAVNIAANAFRDYEEELVNIWRKYQKVKKGE